MSCFNIYIYILNILKYIFYILSQQAINNESEHLCD